MRYKTKYATARPRRAVQLQPMTSPPGPTLWSRAPVLHEKDACRLHYSIIEGSLLRESWADCCFWGHNTGGGWFKLVGRDQWYPNPIDFVPLGRPKHCWSPVDSNQDTPAPSARLVSSSSWCILWFWQYMLQWLFWFRKELQVPNKDFHHLRTSPQPKTNFRTNTKSKANNKLI